MNKKKLIWSVVYWVLFVLLLIWMCDDDGHVSPYSSGLRLIRIFMTDFANWIMLIIALIVLIATGRITDFFRGFKNAYSNTPMDIEKSEKAWKVILYYNDYSYDCHGNCLSFQ